MDSKQAMDDLTTDQLEGDPEYTIGVISGYVLGGGQLSGAWVMALLENIESLTPLRDIAQEQNDKIRRALDMAQNGSTDGAHHKTWVIDQLVRILTGCPTVMVDGIDSNNQSYTYPTFGESEEYEQWVREFQKGEDGPNTYEWETGTPP